MCCFSVLSIYTKSTILVIVFLFFSLLGCGPLRQTNFPVGEDIKTTSVTSFDLFKLDSTRVSLNEIGVKSLGSINSGEVIVGSFAIMNTLDKPVVIFDLRGTCGCLSFEYDKTPINKDSSKRINYRYDSKGKRGKQYIQVRMASSEGEYVINMECDVK